MSKKPCIQCGTDCEIFPVELGEMFTLTYLRLCGAECLFLVAWDYLCEIGHHKEFRNRLPKKQNEEDAAECKSYVDRVAVFTLERLLSATESGQPPLPKGRSLEGN